MKLTPKIASEIRYKLGVLQETDDLLEHYKVSEDQVQTLIDGIPDEGVWVIPEQHKDMVAEEINNHITILKCQMYFAADVGNHELSRKISNEITSIKKAQK